MSRFPRCQPNQGDAIDGTDGDKVAGLGIPDRAVEGLPPSGLFLFLGAVGGVALVEFASDSFEVDGADDRAIGERALL